jgi:hypothetical protein
MLAAIWGAVPIIFSLATVTAMGPTSYLTILVLVLGGLLGGGLVALQIYVFMDGDEFSVPASPRPSLTDPRQHTDSSSMSTRMARL